MTFNFLMEEDTKKELEALILSEAKKWTDQNLHMERTDLVKNMPDSLIHKLDSIEQLNDAIKDLAQRKLISVSGTGMYVISDDGIFYFRKFLEPLSNPANQERINKLMKTHTSEENANAVNTLLNDVKDLPQDQKGTKILDFIKSKGIDVAYLLFRIAVELSTKP